MERAFGQAFDGRQGESVSINSRRHLLLLLQQTLAAVAATDTYCSKKMLEPDTRKKTLPIAIKRVPL